MRYSLKPTLLLAAYETKMKSITNSFIEKGFLFLFKL